MAQSCVNISNNVALDLEKKIESICKEASSYYSSLFKKMSFKNLDNAKILYEFLISEQNYQNVKLSTTITHIKAIRLFNQYIHYKDFEKITKNIPDNSIDLIFTDPPYGIDSIPLYEEQRCRDFNTNC